MLKAEEFMTQQTAKRFKTNGSIYKPEPMTGMMMKLSDQLKNKKSMTLTD
jgi:hypothetical protein